ncbi:hypothetical protein HPB47_011988 [Ixodes persulcatus]|uniref:Uncharacterized protein n=1 Tax=Ixodes persulcatus TaxID=34615 RepID=A0AC60NUX3_IXOPE|nr:hypothetical protein HPB47_011988 [Ixodes persulcatus]
MTSGNSGIIIWQWNCRGFADKKAVLQQHIKHEARKPDVILLQETLRDAPTRMDYREHVCTIEGRELCKLVRKGLTFVDHELGGVKVEHSFVQLMPTKHRKQSIFVLNVYRNPSNRGQRFRALLQKAIKTAGSEALIAGGDVNVAEAVWAYGYSMVKGRNLAQDMQELDFALITDLAHLTRLGNSSTRDTTPVLTFVRNAAMATVTWSNTTVDQGTDHAIIEKHVPTPDRMQGSKRIFTRTGWEDFRRQMAGDLQLGEQTLGSAATPQSSTISPTLFNLVMIGVAEKLQDIEDVRHTIYADDITLWVHRGSDGHIESTLQSAIDAIEAHLQGTGLRCLPKKSKLLLYRPAQRANSKVYKIAFGLPESTRTDRLLQLDIYSTLNEIAEAQRTSQVERLTGTNVGRRILAQHGIRYHTQQGHKVTVPDAIRQRIRVDPIPRNVHPEYN